jgi:hypothetical protein
MGTDGSILSTLISTTPPNIIFTLAIIGLIFVDIFLEKDMKGQIVSVGVLGTFFGIFIGLQDFDPNSMKSSVNSVLEGLKTAFATSILGMGSAIGLSVYQKIRDRMSKNSMSEDEILREINKKLDNLDSLSYLPRLDNTLLINKLESIMNSIQNSSLNSQNTSNDEQILRTLIEIKNQQIRTSSANREMLENELAEIRNSLNIATQELSKGATEEITEALKAVIENFNENLTAQFGDNFVKLNDAVFKLVEWQENYKQHVEDMEHRLEVSTSSVEKSRHSIEAIAEANREVSTLYEKLSAIISTYHTQSANLNTDLEKLHTLAPEISEIVGQMGNSFVDMKTAFGEMLGSVIVENEKIGDSFKKSSDAILDSFTNGQSSLERQRYEINAITNHFRTMGEQVPEALRVSLIELEKALTTITHKFQRDYEEVMLRYKGNLE